MNYGPRREYAARTGTLLALLFLGVAVSTAAPSFPKPKRLLVGLASKRLAPYIKGAAPINLDWGDLYPTTATLPGAQFIPRSGTFRRVIEQYRRSTSGVVSLPPGDYALRVLVFCTHGGRQRVGPVKARWHEQFALGPLRGSRAEALAALYARAAVAGTPYRPTQHVSWDITNGLKYADFPAEHRALFDQLIRDYRPAVSGSQLEQIEDKWNEIARLVPGLPSLEEALDDLGSVGTTIRDLRKYRQAILDNARDFDATTRVLAPIVAPEADAPITPASWSKIADHVYARMLVPPDFRGIGSTTTLEFRILAGATAADMPIGRIIGYPECTSCQPLTLEPVPGEPQGVDCDIAAKIEQLGKTSAEQQRLRHLSQQLLGALAKLRAYRNAFVSDRRYINLFPTFYYHVTDIELTHLARGELSHPIEKMEQMLLFFDAYQVNREAWDHQGKVEKHWRDHFERAQGKLPTVAAEALTGGMTGIIDFREGQMVLDSAITAHVDNDLARALRESYRDRFHQDLSRDDLRGDYNQTNSSLRESVEPIMEDLAEASGLPAIAGTLAGMATGEVGKGLTTLTDNITEEKRPRAWVDAFGDRPLRAKQQQPHTNHDALEEAFREGCLP